MNRRRVGLNILFTTIVVGGCGGQSKSDQVSENAPGADIAIGATEPGSATPAAGATRKPLDTGTANDRAIRHETPTGDLEVTWRDADISGAKRKDSDFIYAKIESKSDAEQFASLVLVAAGLDGRSVKHKLEVVHLAPREIREVAVRVDALPLQSEVGPSNVVVQAEYQGADGTHLYVPTSPLYYVFQNGYRTATFYDERDLFTKLDPRLAEHDAMDVQGRILQEDGSWLQVDRSSSLLGDDDSENFRQGLSTISMIRVDQKPIRKAMPNFVAEPRQGDLAPQTTSKICTRWRAFYRDSGRGEDFMTTQDWHYEPAAFTYAQILSYDSTTTVWEGNLDASGCVTIPTPAAGAYRVIQYTDQITFGQIGFDVTMYLPPPNDYTYVQSINTAFNLKATGGTYNISPTFNTDATNIVPIVGRTLAAQNERGGLGLQPGWYYIDAYRGCGSDLGSDACFDRGLSDHVKSGTTVINGYRGAYWKFMLAHEIGHMAQYFGIGTPFDDLRGNTFDSTNELCTCNHYDPGWGNKVHCMQSREEQGGAQQEGFGHAFAVRLFNRTNETDPVMVYYKPVKLTPSTTPSLPPVPLSAWSVSPSPWMRSKCPTLDAGVEWDWMVFFFRISTEASSNFTTFQDLVSIYRRACGGTCWNGQHINFAALQTAALAHFGGSTTNPKFVRFRDLGATTGVNF